MNGSHVRAWAAATSVPRLVLQGDADPITTAVEVETRLAGTGITVRAAPGDHHLPLRRPGECLTVLQELLERLE